MPHTILHRVQQLLTPLSRLRRDLPQVTTAVREISPAHYDAALRAAPDDCPLLCVAGDRRSGAELLAGLDETHAARGLGSACWAEQLDRLAADLGARLARA